MDKLIKPYEISVWEDTLDSSNNGLTYKEIKIAVIGSNTMDGYNKIYNPVFTKKNNGEKTLSFSLKYQYFDPYIGATVINPFASYLINERKIKLYYDEQWYDFLIKDHTESSDGLIWTYTATDAFVNELSKNGYNKEFDAELGNNQGTAIELAKAVVEGTEWTVDEENSSVGQQEISEAIYNAKLNPSNNIKIVNVDNGQYVTFSGIQSIFVFYNYVANQDGKFVQFILQETNPHDYEVDDNNTIRAINYRIETDLVYDENGIFKKDNGDNTYTNIITIVKNGERLDLDTDYHAYRKVYGQLSVYDPVMKRTVKRYKLNGLDSEIYNYTDYLYTTSDLVTNFITNGDNFNTFDNGTLQGWRDKAESAVIIDNKTIYADTKLVTYPAIEPTSALKSLTSYTQIEGYMEVKFPDIFDNYRNGIFNSGIEDNAKIIKAISKGDQFVFRWRGAKSNSRHGDLSSMDLDTIRVVVAKYSKSDTQASDYYYHKLDSKNIILDFNTTAQELNNYISGGVFPTNQGTIDYSTYTIDGIIQEPSTKYIYQTNGKNYIWNSDLLKYVELDSDLAPFFPSYYYMTGTAQLTVTEAELSETSTNIGIFIYTKKDSNKYYYFQDIQLTRLYKDGSNQIITIGNMPTAESKPIEYFYIKPKTGADPATVEIYTTLSALADSLNTKETNIKPIYNTNSVKYLSISESHSNCYNLLQTIAETFECWVDLVVDHDNQGYITYRYIKTSDNEINPIKAYYIRNGSGTAQDPFTYSWVQSPNISNINNYYERKTNKYICLRDYVGKDNFAGFKYGINLNTIERTVNSDEIVTKLYVTPAQSDYTDEGSVAISYASMNPSGEEYILNFDYYYKQKLIANISDTKNDINTYYNTISELNKQLRAQEDKRRNLETALTVLNSQRNVFKNLIDEAKNNVNDGKEDFYSLTGKSYDGYRGLKTSEEIQDLYYFPTNDTTVWKYKDYFKHVNNKYIKVTTFEDGENPSAKHYYEYLADLENNNTIVDIIAKIYTNSYAINNYAGLLTNIEKEYKQKRFELKGSEEFTITIGLYSINSGSYRLKISLNDYVVPFKFRVNNQLIETDINTKTFEFTTSSPNITIDTLPSNYSLVDSDGKQVTNIIVPSTERIIVLTLKPNTVYDGVEDVIEKLQKLKNMEVELFHNKYNRFIQEGTWSSTDYIDSNLYYLDALSVSNTSAQPQITYSINVVEISELEDFKWYKFDVGDKTYVEDTEFFGWSTVGDILTPAREEVIVSEVEWHLEEPENNIITVQNYKTRFEDLFQRINATVQTVEYNEATYAKTSSLIDAYGMLSQTVLLNSLNNISGQPYTLTSDGSVSVDGDRITIRDLKNRAANIMTLEGSGLRISSDGGKTWTTAINAYGINLDIVNAGEINTDKIIIGSDSNPSFRWDKSGISAYKRYKESDTYDLNTYVRFDQYGLYGIANDSVFAASSLEEVKDKANFGITWDGFFIKNSYEGGGQVEITSNNDFRVLKSGGEEKIKIGALEWKDDNNQIVTTPLLDRAPYKYGIRISNNQGDPVFETGDDGNITITGIINATGGNFNTRINVGPEDQNHIIIDGTDGPNSPSISSSTYSDGAGTGWIINKDGDAVFNNITARGSIKTAVFEYAEIQAVGGIFLFRPSSTIKSARVEGVDLILKVEKPLLFTKISYIKVSNPDSQTNPHSHNWYEKTSYGGYQLTRDTSVVTDKEYFVKNEIKNGSWCKISNYTSDGTPADATIQNILLNNGLTHVYKIIQVNSDTKEVTLSGGAAMVTGSTAITTLEELEGGALIDMGRQDGSSNYGIGVNSSDNTVNLPARAISLFETRINPNEVNNVKVVYQYRGILGTLPILEYTGNSPQVDQLYHDNLEGTQGIYTDNLYIGNNEQYIAFYTDKKQQKHLKINAKELTFKAGSYSKYGRPFEQNFIYLSNEDYSEPIAINTTIEKTDWRQIIGNNFGVDKAGNLYASNAHISGTIYADSGVIGGAAIDENGQLIVDQSQVNNLQADLTQIHREASIKGYTLAVDTNYSEAQEVTLTAHLYYGEKDVTEDFPETMFYWYYKDENISYVAVEQPEGNPKTNNWYELMSNGIALTEDTTIVEGKTYYQGINSIKPIGNFYGITFNRNNAGYGVTVVCSFAIDDEVLLTTPDNYALATPDEYLLTARV